MRRRLDAELVRRCLVPSREQAQRAIAEHRVLVSGAVAEKASRLVGAGEPITLVGDGPRFVSRGDEKLAGALERFGVDPTGRTALDAGSSTGGFTDCLLQSGAVGVVAVDVGTNQLHERLRADPRVEVHEGCNLRTADLDDMLDRRRFDLLVGDLSFISLQTVAGPILGLAAPGADLILLVKPQFEAGRQEVARGRGIVTDPAVWRRTLEEVTAAYANRGAAMMAAMRSPITGTDGNVEFLVHLRVGAPVGAGGTSPALLDAAVLEATGGPSIGEPTDEPGSVR